MLSLGRIVAAWDSPFSILLLPVHIYGKPRLHTCSHDRAVLFMDFLLQEVIRRVLDFPHMPQFGDSSKLGAAKRGKTMEVETIYGHAREQTAEVCEGQHSQLAKDVREGIVKTTKIIRCGGAEKDMTSDNVWAVQMPLAVSEDAVVDGDTSCNGEDGKMLLLTLSHDHIVPNSLDDIVCLLWKAVK